jgi:predicted PurR-regulated permease PerM
MESDKRPSVSALFVDRLGRLGIRSAQLLLIAVLAGLLVFGLVQVKLVVLPVLIAFILSAALRPVVTWLRRHRFSAALATWTTLLSGILIFGGLVTLIVFIVRGQWPELARSAGRGIDELQAFVASGPIPVSQEQVDAIRSGITDFVSSSQFGTGALAGVSAVTETLTGAVLVGIILFFFLKDGDLIWSFLQRPFHGESLARLTRIGAVAPRVLGSYVRGTVVIALADAVLIGTGLAILQVPLALPLAVIIFLTAFIPLIGATVAGILAALVALVANGWIVALIVVAIVIVVNQLEGDLLNPLVMSQSLKLHPLVILFALTVGTILGGIAGAVLAVPLAAVTWSIVRVWDAPEPDQHPLPNGISAG